MSDERIALEKLKEELPKAMMWQPCGDNLTLWNEDRYSYEVDKHTLDQIDIRLYPVIKHLISITNYGYGNEIRGDIINETMLLWERGFPELVTVSGESRRVLNVLNFYHCEEKEKSVWRIHRAHVSNTELQVNALNQLVEYVEQVEYEEIIVEDSWMANAYPGWKTRLLACESLNIPPQMFLTTVLITPEIVLPAALPDTNFP